MSLFKLLGFQWDRQAIPLAESTHDFKKISFHFLRMLPEYVWDAGVLEGNPFTFPEVKTVLEGITVGGRKLSDQEQIINLYDSAKRLLQLVQEQTFALEKGIFCELNGIVARKEALEWGHFRGEGAEQQYTPQVALGSQGRYKPAATQSEAANLIDIFNAGVEVLLAESRSPWEQAFAFFLFAALQQFFFDGNKRTGRLMMNGILMTHGLFAISVPASKAQEFNEKMVNFFVNREGTEMMTFLHQCYLPGETS